MQLLRELRKRRLPHILGGYLAAGFLVLEGTDQLIGNGLLPGVAYRIALVLYGFGTVGTALLAWFHGEKGIQKPRRIEYWLHGGLVVAAVATAGIVVARFDPPASDVARTVEANSVAVLPFTVLGGDAADLEFADGVHDDLLTQLSKIGSLKVISRTSVMTYRDTEKKLREIAAELGVASVLEGGMRRAGDRIRINVQLIDAATDEHLWAETFDRDLSAVDIFDMQTEIATHVARAFQASLSMEEQRALRQVPTDDIDAYTAYLRANVFSRGVGSERELREAVRLYERATELDPEFAQAYAALAIVHTNLVWRGYDRPADRLPLARAAIDRAQQIDPDLPESHLALGLYYYWGFRDYERALRELALAEDRLSGNVLLLATKGFIQRRTGRWEESIVNVDRAIALDPLNGYLLTNQALTLQALRRYDESETYVDRVLSVNAEDEFAIAVKLQVPLYRDGDIGPYRAYIDSVMAEAGLSEFSGIMIDAWWLAMLAGDYETALEYARIAPEVLSSQTEYYPQALLEGLTYKYSGNEAAALVAFESALERLESEARRNPEDHRILASLGVVRAGLGMKDSAIRAGLRAIELFPGSRDAYVAGYLVYDLGVIYAMVGENARAVTQFDRYLSQPGQGTVKSIPLDPRLRDLVADSAFQRLLEKHTRQSE